MKTTYTPEELLDLLKSRKGAMSNRAYAEEIGLSEQMLSDVFLGKRGVSNQAILSYLAPRGKIFVGKTVYHLAPKD